MDLCHDTLEYEEGDFGDVVYAMRADGKIEISLAGIIKIELQTLVTSTRGRDRYRRRRRRNYSGNRISTPCCSFYPDVCAWLVALGRVRALWILVIKSR